VAGKNGATLATAETVNEGRKVATSGKRASSKPKHKSDQAPKSLRDPFNPKTGEFADNIRLKGEDDLTELRESLKQFGWSKQFPALMDENDVVLVGHRRMKVAKELEIEPVVRKLNIGQGDAADAERLKLAIVSNIGFKPMTKNDRKRIAEYLYGEREWTMECIAEALNVSARTISTDLDGFEGASKPDRPKGGRPKGSKQPIRKPAKKKRRTADDFKRDIVAKKAAVAPAMPVKIVHDPVAPDEELALLREFARWVVSERVRVTYDLKDRDEWRALFNRVKAVLGAAP
jgi:ParB-like chromosome segregation protein Spo0J